MYQYYSEGQRFSSIELDTYIILEELHLGIKTKNNISIL